MFAKQLTVFIENRAGRLSEVLGVLKDNDVNIISMSLECVKSPEEVKNIMTFLAGVVFALRADIVSVSDQVWLLYPKHLVQLSKDEQDDK